MNEGEAKGDSSGSRSDSDASTECDPRNELQYSEEPKNEVHLPEEPDKELDSPEQREKDVQHSENTHDLNISIELEENSTSNKLQTKVKLSKQARAEEQLSKERKTNKARNWSSIRISLQAIERLMSLRVKDMKLINDKKRTLTKDSFPSIEEIEFSGGENEEDIEKHETSDDDANTTMEKWSVNKGYPHRLCQWKEELDFLVRGGVPKDLRGEVNKCSPIYSVCLFVSLLDQVCSAMSNTDFAGLASLCWCEVTSKGEILRGFSVQRS